MQLVWLVPHLQHPGLAEACDAEVARLEAAARRGAAAGSLLCVRVEKGAASLPQRMALLAAKAAGELLLLCPRAVLEFAEVEPEEEAGEEEEGAEDLEAAQARCAVAASFLLRVRQNCEYNPAAYHELIQVAGYHPPCTAHPPWLDTTPMHTH